ncbi:protein of unknown function (plasmid) [Cupriavidus taiwanensis]|uniref:Uncharacterized protein n=1 Tax=Cupriavidus taiwanensis TaxID=164546 RepID=A0A375IV12_9BURK|nr:protein of unknown function [Cupriavidus taiwanensis]
MGFGPHLLLEKHYYVFNSINITTLDAMTT